jgi:hypothetical protein
VRADVRIREATQRVVVAPKQRLERTRVSGANAVGETRVVAY